MGRLRIRAGTRRDHDRLAGLLRGLSLESAYLRFQTGLGPEPAPALVAALLPDRTRGTALLAFHGSRLVGHGLWVRAKTAPVADVALVVADEFQQRGIGTALVDALVADLTGRDLRRVEVFASATNHAVERMVARQAPDAARERDGATVTYQFHAAPRAVRTVA
jgi:GNAT superfamily N-acetyltransferase